MKHNHTVSLHKQPYPFLFYKREFLTQSKQSVLFTIDKGFNYLLKQLYVKYPDNIQTFADGNYSSGNWNSENMGSPYLFTYSQQSKIPANGQTILISYDGGACTRVVSGTSFSHNTWFIELTPSLPFSGIASISFSSSSIQFVNIPSIGIELFDTGRHKARQSVPIDLRDITNPANGNCTQFWYNQNSIYQYGDTANTRKGYFVNTIPSDLTNVLLTQKQFKTSKILDFHYIGGSTIKVDLSTEVFSKGLIPQGQGIVVDIMLQGLNIIDKTNPYWGL